MQTRDQMSEDAAAKLRLIASELVNNAVQHGQGEISMRLGRSGSTIRVEVVDEGTGNAPTVREHADDDTSGRGLQIVDGLAERWGAHEGTTHVWAEVALD